MKNSYLTNLLVIHERDHDDHENIIIGVADGIENAELMIEEYYGIENYTEIAYNEIRDSNLEYDKVLEIAGPHNSTYRVTVTLEWFYLNEI